MYIELQEIISSQKGNTTTEQDDVAATMAKVVGDVRAMVIDQEVVDLDLVEESNCKLAWSKAII